MGIIRIVKMEFKDECVSDFVDLFGSVKNEILDFPGCLTLQLLRDLHNENIFFTYSAWGSEMALKKYRNSLFFKSTWATTKKYFNARPAAWSTIEIDHHS